MALANIGLQPNGAKHFPIEVKLRFSFKSFIAVNSSTAASTTVRQSYNKKCAQVQKLLVHKYFDNYSADRRRLLKIQQDLRPG